MREAMRLLLVLLAALIAAAASPAFAEQHRAQIFANGQVGSVKIPYGLAAHITWSADAPNGACGVYGPAPTGYENSNIFNGGGVAEQPSPGQDTARLTQKSVYTLHCRYPDGSTATASVIVKPFLWVYATIYPLATASSLAFYLILLALAVPRFRRTLGPHLAPVAPHQHYLQAFDAFRGFAAGLVAIGHCWWATYPVFASTQFVLVFLAWDSKAVPMFAVLSGFLIYRSVLSIRSLEDLRRYAIRRFFRVYPVYVLGIVMGTVAWQYIPGEHYTSLGYLFSDIFMLKTVEWPGPQGNPPTWSLYVEVVFYALLPLVVLTVGRKRMVLFALLCLVAMLFADAPSRIFGLWKFFLIGIIASEASLKMRSFAAPAFILGAALLIYDFGGPTRDWFGDFGLTAHHGDGETIGLGLGCALFLAALPHLGAVAKAMNVLPLRLLGTISYSVYVTHFFYILANFPEIKVFNNAGTQPLYQHFLTLQSMPAWYMPFIFFPGIFFWGIVSFLLVERPGIQFGGWVASHARSRLAIPAGRSVPAE